MKLTKLFKEFFESEKSTGILLIGCTIISLLLANSAIGPDYTEIWETQFASHSIEYWINDGLMAIFFLLIGLELKREVFIGELSKVKNAMLPIFAALGGIIIPATIYTFFNYGTPEQSGSGIPMATDIAFALGILSILGKRVPNGLKVFLAALAIIDDLGAIIIIAVFYTETLMFSNLMYAIGIFVLLLALNRLKVRNLLIYLIGGVIMWYFMLVSGVHATVAGVLLAFTIPFGNGDENSISYRLQHFLHHPVNFIILPVFAIANTAIVLSGDLGDILSHNYSIGILTGLVVGKPLGIFFGTFIAFKLGLGKLPTQVSWTHIFGVGLLGGIGFTMSIFIALLAFDNATIINNAKLVILISSLIAGSLGYLTLHLTLRDHKKQAIKA